MMNQTMLASRVLTLEETANYLRLPETIVERQAKLGQIPAGASKTRGGSYEMRLTTGCGATIAARSCCNKRVLWQMMRVSLICAAAIYAERGRPEATA